EIFGKEFFHHQSNPEIWDKIYKVEDEKIWSLKEELRGEMIEEIKGLLEEQMRRRNESPNLIVETIRSIRKDVLTIGFARRFATYKRAYLLFTNENRLRALLTNDEKPMQFIFAGKAHPNDKAGQDLIKRIIEFSRKPEFIGKIIFVENYDMILAKKMISGCDVWLNTPTRPLEASGTSGEKAVMNGVLNFSVLDGWWAEGYQFGAGWAINEQITYTDNRLQDELDATTMYAMFEEQIVPAFYQRNNDHIPEQWVAMMKNCFAKISPHFTMKRQLDDYYTKFYYKLEARTKLLNENDMQNTFKLVRWKEKVLTAWENIEVVHLTLPSSFENNFFLGEKLTTILQLKIGNLEPQDLKIEMIFVTRNEEKTQLFKKHTFIFKKEENGVTTFECNIEAKNAGVWNCAVRVIPANPLLPHDMDFNLVKWV
ncbi:MAG: alpha-glucan family phosphorylase, partial [Bacteroidales bacterium]